ncbi:MAG: M1 family aminopeptidase, partial [Acidobacteria bacterium]|nr:M1 family aminopeptidase [Acidobacteriota bacterium]
SLRLQEPVDGVVTGLWFEGHGRLRLPVPDPIELRQLRRLLKNPDLDILALSFDRMLLRSSGGPPSSLFPAPTAGGSRLAIYERRHERYVKIWRLDVDSRVVAALGIPGATYWRADIRTADHGWLTVTYDSQEAEELTVEYFDSSFDFLESWLSLDRAAERTAEGRPVSLPNPVFDINHIDLRADLTQVARKYSRSIDGRFWTRVELEVLQPDVSVLPFALRARARVTAVSDGTGQALEWIRSHFGGRSGSIDKEVYDTSLLVFLPTSVKAGAELAIHIDYELRIPKYASGRSWYPGGRDTGGLHDRHTARLELTVDDRHGLQAMGELVEERSEGRSRTSVWRLDRPAKMITFTMQKHTYAKKLEQEGVPSLTTVGEIGERLSGLNEERIDHVAEVTLSAIDYLQQVLDFPLPDKHFYATLIPAGHGQAFPGFLHLSELTAVLDSAAAVERFRAHEAAHQWWGHIVGWNCYRDQWLSEGFAEYMALMYVHDVVDGGDKIFREAITAYNNEIRGSLQSAFSRFARPGYALLTSRGAERIGPIAHGWRAGVGETPTAYQTLAYYKGAMVLHMLRTIVALMTKSDDAFIAILRDFVRSHVGGYATTDDFQAAVERNVPADWSWFFDQWVYGAEIPTYAWDYEIVTAGGEFTLRINVEQSDVSPGFKMLVPVEVAFGRGQTGKLAVFVDQPSTTFEFQLSSKPRKVTFNAGDAVIAKVKRR